MAKEYNIKAIVDKEDLKLIFECDKEKNKQCNKKYCGTCNHTTDTRYMKAKARPPLPASLLFFYLYS